MCKGSRVLESFVLQIQCKILELAVQKFKATLWRSKNNYCEGSTTLTAKVPGLSVHLLSPHCNWIRICCVKLSSALSAKGKLLVQPYNPYCNRPKIQRFLLFICLKGARILSTKQGKGPRIVRAKVPLGQIFKDIHCKDSGVISANNCRTISLKGLVPSLQNV